MKLTVEFEEDDLRDMFTKFFKEAGFEVLSLDDICEQFGRKFPDGIKVLVEPGEVPVEAPVNTLKEKSSPEKHSETVTSLVSLGDDEDDTFDEGPEREPVAPTAMSMTDLMDPTLTEGSGDISAINKIIDQSVEIEIKETAKKNKA